MLNDNYPDGTLNNPEAPWNEKIYPLIEVEVTVSMTLSKTFKIKTNKYVIGENGEPLLLDEGIKEDILNTINLPNESAKVLSNLDRISPQLLKKYKEGAIRDLSDWNVDDFIVIPECI